MILLALLLQAQSTPAPLPYRPAAATIVAEPVAMTIAAFDTDGDARVTKAEVTAGVERSFASIDTDKKGTLGYIAFADWATRWLGDPNAVPSPFEVDRDGDNRITLTELQDRFAEIFDRFDKDKDGILIRSELLTIRGSATRMPDDRERDRDRDREDRNPRKPR